MTNLRVYTKIYQADDEGTYCSRKHCSDTGPAGSEHHDMLGFRLDRPKMSRTLNGMSMGHKQ